MLSTRQVAQRFAWGHEGEASSLYSQRRPSGHTVLRSYATPIAVLDPERKRAVFSSPTHSMTTTRHRTVALHECRELLDVVVVDDAEFERLLDEAGVDERGRAS